MSAVPRSVAAPGGAAASVNIPAPPAAPASPDAADEPRPLTLRFTGSAGEYFRIWIVNICLTLLTLGIFSAWAKVRKKRYFYSHTELDGTPFQYLAQPLPILKGRLIAAALFGLWYVGTHYVLALLPVVLVLALVLAPWVMVRSAAFNARYSAFRNMTFAFDGSYLSAARTLYGWALVGLLTFGIGFAWFQQRLRQYLIGRVSYGGESGEFSASGLQFLGTYVRAFLLFGAAVAGLAVLFGMTVAGMGAAAGPEAMLQAMLPWLIGFLVAIYALNVAMYAYIQARLTNLTWNHTQLGPVTFESSLPARGLLALYVTNALAILASAGLLIPWAVVRTARYRIEHLAVTAEGDLATFAGSEETNVRAAGAEVGELFDFDFSL
jgi:uncharacterized membrane protein YjgN (DUF898 family)